MPERWRAKNAPKAIDKMGGDIHNCGVEASTNAVAIPFLTPANPANPQAGFWIPVMLMLVGALIGSIALYSYQSAFSLQGRTAGRRRDRWKSFVEFLKIFGMGIGCVALIPAFLRMTLSNLFTETTTSLEARFVFVGFCVAATISARRFLTLVPKQLLDKMEKTEEIAARAEEKTTEIDQKRLIDVVVKGASDAIRTPQDDPSYSASLCGALERMDELLKENPTSAKLAATRGLLLRRLNRLSDAIGQLEKTIEARRKAQIPEDRLEDGDLFYNLACYLNVAAGEARIKNDSASAENFSQQARASFGKACQLYPKNLEIGQHDPDLNGLV